MLEPSIFLVSDAHGKILILDLSLPLLFKKSTIDTLSIIGLVLGMVTTEVTPPERAASLSVLKFSLYSKPGSPTKTLISTNPGKRCFPFKSTGFSRVGRLFVFTFFPTASILPSSPTIKPPTSLIEL